MLYTETPIHTFIQNHTSFETLREDIKNNGMDCKSDDDLLMFYNQNFTEDMSDIAKTCRSVVIDSSMKPIFIQYNQIIYNDDAVKYVTENDWNNMVVQKCIEGTFIVVFWHNGKWYVTTRRCLDADSSVWIKNSSYYYLFMDAIDGKFSLDTLDKNNCYHFILVHHKNKNIVSYNGINYKNVYHVLTTEKYTLKEVEYTIENAKMEPFMNLDNLDKVLEKVGEQNELDSKYKRITGEGYVLRHYLGEKFNSPFITLKLQTPIYQMITKLKPNMSNIYQCFLEMYQKDVLTECLPYFNVYGTDTIKRIHRSIINHSKEIHNLYHLTRNKKNEHIYNLLTGQYKKCLYDIHGLFLTNRSTNKSDDKEKQKITISDVYNYLKKTSTYELRQLYFDRNTLSEHQLSFINNCRDTKDQYNLMYPAN